MPMSPRFDPRWLVIPAIALMIALGIPRQVPIPVSARVQPLPAHAAAPAAPGTAQPAGGAAENSAAGSGGPPPFPPALGEAAGPGRPPSSARPTAAASLTAISSTGVRTGMTTRWRPPLDGSLRVARAFRPPAHPYGAGHRGVDLAGAADAAVRAAGDGTVAFAGWVGDRSVVSVAHGGLRTTYEPVEPTVRAGQRVAAGAVLGRLAPGHPGCPGTACLHWGLLRGTTYLDPLGLLRRGKPRLLPLAAPAAAPGTGS